MKIELKDVLGPILTSAALFSGVMQYRATSYTDFVKPVRDLELEVYYKTVETTALIATLPRGSRELEQSRNEFLRLYYGSLTMFQDFDHGGRQPVLTVNKAAAVFETCLERQDCRDDANALSKLSRALAYTCRESLRDSWRYQPKGFDQNHLDTIVEYEKRFQLTH